MTLCRLLATMLAFAVPVAAQAQPSPKLVASSKVAVVSTQSGQVQGFVKGGISTFRGVPYAVAERFRAPAKPPKWDGVRHALSYGNICPQPVNPQLPEPQTFLSDWVFWPQSENCLNLNVWTPGSDGRKRPVMVWFHGGGFFSGSSIELPPYNGENLSRMGDVVVVTVNHRLNILGFLDLSAHGEEYKASGNAGLADLVAALQWVRDNAAAFGGDPSNVTIFGQSGGGGKVATLLAAPSAKGLFHKAIVMSGVMGPPEARATDQKTSRRVAELTIQFAGLQPGDVAGLQKISYEQLNAAGAKALSQVSKELSGEATGGPLGFPRVNWGPVHDKAFLPDRPFLGGAPAVAADVPLMIGSTLAEFQLINPRIKGRESWPQDQLAAYLRQTYGDRTDAIFAAFRKAYPKAKLHELLAIDPGGRAGALGMARAKAVQSAPVYNYLFAWKSPVLDYGWAAGHTADVAFVFNNAALGVQSSGGGPEVDKLTRVMSQAWINFARTGNPNHKGLPVWPAFTADKPATMVFDTRSHAVIGHDGELIELLNQGGPPRR